MKKILVLSQFFYPDKTGTGKILAELFFSLNKKEFSVDVISGRKKYSDLSQLVLKEYEVVDDVKIYRTFRWFASKDTSIGRIYNYIMFFICASWKCFRQGVHKDKDLIVSVSNPPIMPLLGAILKNSHRRFIYVLHDLYPDIAIAMNVVGKKHLFSRTMFAVNRYIFSKVDKVVVLGRDMEKHLMDHYHVPKERISVVSNWATSSCIEEVGKKNLNKFRILYTGNMGRFHNLELAIETVRGIEDIELIFVGEGALKDKLISMSSNMNNVRFLSYLDDTEYQNILFSADALLVSLEKNLSGLAVPSKFYTYLAVGKPILCISDQNTEMALSIKECDCGFVIGHEDISGFRNALDRLKNSMELKKRMGQNGRMLFEAKYIKETVIKQYEELFKTI